MSDEVGKDRDATADLAVCAAATDGPWDVLPLPWHDGDGTAGVAVSMPDLGVCWVSRCTDRGEPREPQPEDRADAAFVSLARSALPYWIGRAEAAEAENARLRAVVGEWTPDFAASRLAASLAETFDRVGGGEARNGVTLSFAHERGPIEVTVRPHWGGGKTPAEVIEELRQENASLRLGMEMTANAARAVEELATKGGVNRSCKTPRSRN